MIESDEAVHALLREAALMRQRGQAHEERAILDQAISRFPTSPEAQNARGMRALADSDHDLGIACFTRAAEADPAEAALRLNLATAYRAKGDPTGEQRSLQAALDLDQLNFLAQLRMAELLQRQGFASKAVLHWSAVAQIAANLPERPPAVVQAESRAHAFLAEHSAAYARALEEEIGDALTSDNVSRRFRACADHMLGRRQIYHNICSGIHFPFLPADEFFERRHFPWLEELEGSTPAIRREALALLERGDAAIKPYVRLDAGTPENKWTALDQSLDWSACFLWEFGEKNEAVCALCPETAAALARVPQTRLPGKAPSAFFSIIKPGKSIPPHTGVTNTRAIVHLPLVVPDGCGFRVGGETREWREGEAFAFDDTIEHEAWNKSDQLRVVLIFDVWNPHLTAQEQDLLAKLFAVADRGIVAPGS